MITYIHYRIEYYYFTLGMELSEQPIPTCIRDIIRGYLYDNEYEHILTYKACRGCRIMRWTSADGIFGRIIGHLLLGEHPDVTRWFCSERCARKGLHCFLVGKISNELPPIIEALAEQGLYGIE